jgi:hypothetical protein
MSEPCWRIGGGGNLTCECKSEMSTQPTHYLHETSNFIFQIPANVKQLSSLGQQS